MSFANKVVLITGASSGIGAATAISFAKEGANVVIVGINEHQLQKVKEECSKAGNVPLVVRADVSNDEDAKRIIEETIGKYGKLDILVSNAGILGFDGILSHNIMSVFDSIMKTNLRAAIYINHLAAPHLIKTKGNIINISSVVGKITYNQFPILCYSALKAALNHFTRHVAGELAQHGVRVNTISPGPVKTDLFGNAFTELPTPQSNVEQILTPLGRISEAEEIADLILFVASDKAKAMTGSDYVTDNGSMLM